MLNARAGGIDDTQDVPKCPLQGRFSVSLKTPSFSSMEHFLQHLSTSHLPTLVLECELIECNYSITQGFIRAPLQHDLHGHEFTGLHARTVLSDCSTSCVYPDPGDP